jgi:hypothetical protein
MISGLYLVLENTAPVNDVWTFQIDRKNTKKISKSEVELDLKDY